MNGEEDVMLQRVINALNKRYARMNGDLGDAIDALDRLGHKIRAGEPTTRELDATLRLILSATVEGAELQSAVVEMLHDQYGHLRSVKDAYAQGWDARLMDLLTRATPAEAEMLRALLLTDPADDENILF